MFAFFLLSGRNSEIFRNQGQGLNSGVHELRQLVHLHTGQIRGLNSYCNLRISQLGTHERDAELALLGEYVKKAYDEHVGSIDDAYPDLAAKIDI